MYHLNSGRGRGVGLTARNGPKSHLLSTFPKPSSNSEPPVAEIGASGRTNGGSTRGDSSEDELGSSKAPSVTTSPRGRIRRPTPAPETGYDGDEGMNNDDYADIDDFSTPKQPITESSQPHLKLRGGGDITPTVFKTGKAPTLEEREQETQRMLRENSKGRINPQHMRGAGYDVDTVRQQERRAPPSSWDTGKHKKKQNTYAGRSARPRPNTQKKIPSSNLDTDDEDGSQSATPKPSVSQSKKEFRDPTKLYTSPGGVKTDPSPQTWASKDPFRNPRTEYPLPPKEQGSQAINTSSYKSKPKGFQDPREKYKNKTNPPVEIEKPKPKAFMDPFRKYGLSPEPESQVQGSYVDEPDDGFGGSVKGGSKKRKASSYYARTEAIGLSTPRVSYKDEDPLSSSDFSVGESQSSTVGSQLSSQAKRQKAKFEAIDNCVLCDTALPLGTLDNWRDVDGELRPIRMSEWTEICNKHKAADLQKEWKEKGYPVIEWKGLKKRVEKHHQFLVDIVEDKVLSPFRQVFAKQQKETRGNAALLLRKDHQLQYPGYYGPRGSGILLHELTMRLGSFVADTGKRDGLIGKGGVGAFIQTVLVPELGVRLIMEDMDVSESRARNILDESREIGEKLNMMEFTEDIYDEDDGPWFDINATQTPATP